MPPRTPRFKTHLEEDMARRIMAKLHRLGYWGKHHIDKRDICKGVAKHEIGHCKSVVKELIKAGWLERRKVNRYSLSEIYMNDILGFIGKFPY